jgi:DNA-binding HxlR family transcriptional regulator
MMLNATRQTELDLCPNGHAGTLRKPSKNRRPNRLGRGEAEGHPNGDRHLPQTHEECSVQFALTLFQGKWKIGILSRLQHSPVRLSQLRTALPLASKKMLVQHLRAMERDGLIVRTDLSGKLRRVEYSLSDPLGLATLRLLNTLAQWGADYGPIHQ